QTYSRGSGRISERASSSSRPRRSTATPTVSRCRLWRGGALTLPPGPVGGPAASLLLAAPRRPAPAPPAAPQPTPAVPAARPARADVVTVGIPRKTFGYLALY